MGDKARKRKHQDVSTPPASGASPIGTPGKSAPTIETQVVAGRGPTSTIEFQPRPVPLARGLVALRHRDFRLVWIGQLISLTGTWMQIVAQNWLVLVLTDSALVLGLVSALQFLPILTLSILGGVAADRLPKRRILIVTQSLAMILAFVLAILTQTGVVRIEHVMILALMLGIVNAVDMPTRQAFVVELVAPEDLRNAIALNSTAFNSARLAGPAVAGLAIGWIGLAGAFYLNGLSFLAVIVGLVAVNAGRRPVARGLKGGSLWTDLREGIEYAAHTPSVRLVLLLVAVVGTFGMNLNVIIPVLARDALQVGPEGYGLLTSAAGLGSLAAALFLAYVGRTPRTILLLGAAAALGFSEMILADVRDFPLALLLLGCIGFSMIFFTTLANTVLQTATPDALRGRVMSVFTTVFAGTTPIGSLLAGSLAEAWGVTAPLLAGGLISAGVALVGSILSSSTGRKR